MDGIWSQATTKTRPTSRSSWQHSCSREESIICSSHETTLAKHSFIEQSNTETRPRTTGVCWLSETKAVYVSGPTVQISRRRSETSSLSLVSGCNMRVVRPWILWNVSAVRAVNKSCTRRYTNYKSHREKAGGFLSMSWSSSARSRLNHLVTLGEASHRLTILGHADPLSAMRVFWWTKWEMKAMMTL